MTAFVFANYLDTTLAAAASSTAISLSLSSSANLPVLGPGEVMPLTLNDAATGLVYEIVYVTAISGTTLTALRGQEGTSAQNWSSGDYAFVSPTALTVAPVNGTHSPVASETLPVVNELITTPGTLTAAIDLTLNDVAPAGSGGIVFGSESAFTVTVQSPVTTGSPYIELPDGSQVYSWVIPASEPGQGIRYKWDGTNWRGQTFGQTVVAPAAASNEAVQLAQVSTVAPQHASILGTAASTIYATPTISFTAPCDGYVVVRFTVNQESPLYNFSSTGWGIFINGTGHTPSQPNASGTYSESVAVSAGEAMSIYSQVTTPGTVSPIELMCDTIFLPNP